MTRLALYLLHVFMTCLIKACHIKKILFQDWAEEAVIARIKEAGSRDDLQAYHLIAAGNHPWLSEEWLLLGSALSLF